MSDPHPTDEQGRAEALDENVLGAGEVDDIGEDVVHTSYPPEVEQGVDVAVPEEVPDLLAPADRPVTGLMAADDDPDEEVAVVGDPDRLPPAEEAAVHETTAPAYHEDDSYLDG